MRSIRGPEGAPGGGAGRGGGGKLGPLLCHVGGSLYEAFFPKSRPEKMLCRISSAAELTRRRHSESMALPVSSARCSRREVSDASRWYSRSDCSWRRLTCSLNSSAFCCRWDCSRLLDTNGGLGRPLAPPPGGGGVGVRSPRELGLCVSWVCDRAVCNTCSAHLSNSSLPEFSTSSSAASQSLSSRTDASSEAAPRAEAVLASEDRFWGAPCSRCSGLEAACGAAIVAGATLAAPPSGTTAGKDLTLSFRCAIRSCSAFMPAKKSDPSTE